MSHALDLWAPLTMLIAGAPRAPSSLAPLTLVLLPPLTPTLSPLECRQRGEGAVWR
jgi:hypothetical protein